MGDWHVPAGHDGQANEDRDAYHRQRPAISAVSGVRPNKGRTAYGRFFALTKRGLMGVPLFAAQSVMPPEHQMHDRGFGNQENRARGVNAYVSV